jgi:methylase of polypeptide subunit release factors
MSAMANRIARLGVLERLGLERLVTADRLDIAEAHRAHALEQAEAQIYDFEGLTIAAPAGVYHPQASSSSLLFIRNIVDLKPARLRRVWDLGCGSGAVALFLAKRYGADALATDISPLALETTRANAARNGLAVRTQLSDMFERVESHDFDLIVFNTPLIDVLPESEWDRDTMCDPGGDLLAKFAHGVDEYLAPDGFALTAICSNSAYERLEGVRAKMWVVGIEMTGNGFWRAILGVRRGASAR